MTQGCKKTPCICPTPGEEDLAWRKQHAEEAVIHKLKTGKDLSRSREGSHVYQYFACQQRQYLESLNPRISEIREKIFASSNGSLSKL